MKIQNLEQLFEAAKGKRKKRVVVACANDAHTIEAIFEAVQLDIIEGILVGDKPTIEKICLENKIDSNTFLIVHQPLPHIAATQAVEMINNGEADIIMKGLINTDLFMKAILNKEKGLMRPKSILSHVTVFQSNNYHKLLIASDVAVIPKPDLKQKLTIINYMVKVARSLRIDTPKVAAIAPTEQVLPGIESCVEGALLSKMADRGQIPNAVVDGPLALDVAIDEESAQIKKLNSDVAGNADCLLFPDINSGNVFYKSMTKFAKAETAAIVVGTTAPAVLSSRGDTIKTKVYSIALAAIQEVD